MELEELVLLGGEHGAKVRGRGCGIRDARYEMRVAGDGRRGTGCGRRDSRCGIWVAGLRGGWKWIKEAAWWRLMGLCWVLIECNIEGSGLAEGDLDFFLGLCLVSLFAEGDIVLTGHRNF